MVDERLRSQHEPPGPALYPGAIQAVGLLLTAVLLQAAVGTGFGLLYGTADGVIREPGLWGLLNLLAFAPVLYLGWRRAGGTLEVLRLRPVPVRLLVPILLLVIGLAILISELDNVTQRLLGPPPAAFDLSWLFSGPLRVLAGAVFLLVLVAPLTEETLFRGIILRGFLSRYPTAPAILLSAFLFAIFHLNPWQFVGAFVLGAVFGWLYAEIGSLVPCLLGHAAANGFPLVMAVLFPGVPGLTDVTRPPQFHPLWLDLLGLLLAVAGGVWLQETKRER